MIIIHKQKTLVITSCNSYQRWLCTDLFHIFLFTWGSLERDWIVAFGSSCTGSGSGSLGASLEVVSSLATKLDLLFRDLSQLWTHQLCRFPILQVILAHSNSNKHRTLVWPAAKEELLGQSFELSFRTGRSVVLSRNTTNVFCRCYFKNSVEYFRVNC